MATLSEEQLTDAVKQEAALRRVAVLVASGLSPSQVFDAVSAEAGAVLDAESAGIFRFDEDDGVAAVRLTAWATTTRALLPGESRPRSRKLVVFEGQMGDNPVQLCDR